MEETIEGIVNHTSPAECNFQQRIPVRRILIACIGNIFLGDDGFGVEVAQRLINRKTKKYPEERYYVQMDSSTWCPWYRRADLPAASS
jgi:hypothetical protein